ncbi:geranylgeranyltransferase beta subunit [Capsaspora owczarzaki ATCC 30864]|uniref:Geranylgeranyltransferase beta subunit n=1 Tax=Capsaspora owczarzaki (strain ATCC 30864) TaxID=595528 RepID=A0A0D2X1Y3_CAPO3|nr:geranylgeranyltransferase beta subunit [Capsaspora owczarzaki ATCC 30864]
MSDSGSATIDTQETFIRQRHAKYFAMCLKVLPRSMATLDTQRMTLVYFAVSGLDLLNSLALIESRRAAIIDWVYAMQVLPDKDNPGLNAQACGFRPGSSVGAPYNPKCEAQACLKHDSGHLAMSFTALSVLAVLGDDFSRVNRQAIVQSMRALQSDSGEFFATADKNESDVRFLYCACVVSHLIKDWSGVNKATAVAYIKSRQTYDGSFAAAPGLEGHAGYTFLCVASLYLMDQLDEVYTKVEQDRIIRWCIMRQQTGFTGRPGKLVDSCYSFWVGGTLKILGAYDLVDRTCLRGFLLSTQSTTTGGLAKSPDTLAGVGEPDVLPLDAAINMSERASQHAASLKF